MTAQGSSQPFAVHAIWLDQISYRDVGFDQLMKGQPSEVVVGAQANYELTVETLINPPAASDDNRWQGIVRLTAEVIPTEQPTYRMSCAFVAQCSAPIDAPIAFDSYLSTNVTAYLVPYVRERMSSVTLGSRFPVFLLPPVNTIDFAAASEHTGPISDEEPEL